MNAFTLSKRKDDFEVFAEVHRVGDDCLVILWGGTRPHIGAIGMAQVRPSLRDAEKISASSSVFTYVGHKEDMVAKVMSEELTRRLGKNSVVVAGIHWDNLTDKDIKIISEICGELIEEIIKMF